MINKFNFRIKKNGDPTSRCFCRHPELIENYEKAITDETQTWQVHHRLECCFTYKFLVDMGLYYDVEPEALIFLTREEHNKIDSMHKRVSESQKNRKDLSKQVLCIETGGIFASTKDAHRKTGINQSNISQVCLGKRDTAGKFHWKFVQ